MDAAGACYVERGGPPVVRTVGGVQLVKASVSEQDNNAYVLLDVASGAQLLVDAADDADALLGLLRAPAGALTGVVTTHRHTDHHRALAEVVRRTGSPTMAGAEDADELPVAVDVRLHHGDTIELGARRIDVVALRGHTPGSVALACRQPGVPTLLLTGDALFPGGVGRTGSPTDFTRLLDDVEERLFAVLDDDTQVHPGHGDSTTLGAERGRLESWRARGW